MTERAAPAWLRVARAVVRRLPVGRYRAIRYMPATPPFLDRLPAALGGMAYHCDLGDDIARQVCFAGRYAPQETELVAAILRPGDVFADVGANWGYFTLLAASRVGIAGRVLALEPDPRAYAALTANLAANRAARVTALAVAAAEGAGMARLALYHDEAGNRGESALTEAPDGTPVATTALDALLDEQGVAGVTLVKIDVEGAELRVLSGMARGLAAGRYRHVLLELHPVACPGVVEAAGATLRGAGYRGWWIDHSPAATRDAAYGRGTPRARLTPLDAPVPSQPWPHQLWLAPGVELP